MWRKQLRRKRRQRNENGRTGSSKKCNPHCAHQGTPVVVAYCWPPCDCSTIKKVMAEARQK
jgi:hypothetical protein